MTDTHSRNGATPGPWEVGYHAMNVMAKDDKGSFPVCDIRGWGHLTGKGHGALGLPHEQAVAIQEANARLIAAAPELEAELEYIVSYFEGGIMPLDLRDWKERAIAALRKARP